MKPLEGLTVVELGHSVAAPYAGLILADLGARVVKVENPAGGDYARGWGPPFWRDSASAYLSLNRGKESIGVDFSCEADAQALARFIVEEADAVIQNLRPGILEQFDLTAEALRARKSSLIWCDIGAFGNVGPLAAKPGYDPLAQASTGIMSVTGEGGGRPPVRVGVSLIDMGSGMWTVIGLLASLCARAKSGDGEHVMTSLYETGLAWMTVPLANFGASGKADRPHGSGIPVIVPYQAFPTSDGWLMIAAGNDKLFRKLCKAIGLEPLAGMPDYLTNADRVIHREALVAQISQATLGHSAAALGRILDVAGVPNSPLLSVDQVAAHPQTHALGMLQPCEGDELALAGIPLKFSGTRPRNNRCAPALGQDTQRWKAALGVADAK